MLRPLLSYLPAVAAAIVAWALLGGGDERVRYVQVLGGPTRASTLSVLVRALTLDGERRIPIPGLLLRAQARVGGQSVSLSGITSDTGELEASFALDAVPTTDPWVRVESDATGVLAEGSLSLGGERWQAGARRDGGWLRAQTGGTLLVRAAAESGVFAVPFEGNLVLQVLAEPAAGMAGPGHAALPLAGAHVSIELDGAERVTTAPLVTDASGMASIALRPNEHAVSARFVARAGERLGEWYGALPVTPGAILVTRADDGLLVRSPIVRERAYVSLVTAHARMGGAIVPLAANPDGSAQGLLALAPALSARIDAEATWAVVSSEYDKRSAGAVGWPLSPAFDPASPRRTFDVADQVLLDGRDGALYDLQRSRDRRRRGAAAALLVVGALMAASFWAEVRRGRRHGALDAVGPDDEKNLVAPAGWLIGIALGCIILGLGALAYFGLLAR